MLTRKLCVAVVVLSAAAWMARSDVRADEKPADKPAPTQEQEPVKTQEVELRDLKLQLPETWKDARKNSTMRLGTYEVPAGEGDDQPGEFAVFYFEGGGGGLDANLQRWVGQFDADGRDVQIRKGKAGDDEYFVAEISGTYRRPIGPPIQQKTEPAPGYRMLGVVLVQKDGDIYYLKLTGPEATVQGQAEALRKSFGGDAEGEEDYGL